MAVAAMIMSGCKDEYDKIGGGEAPTKAAVTGVVIDPPTMVRTLGKWGMLAYSVLPANAGNKAVTWATSDASIVEVDNMGDIIAKSIGKAIITVTTVEGNFSATCEVTVERFAGTPVTRVTMDKDNLNIETARKTRLMAIIEPSNATIKSVKWFSDDESVATVVNGLVQGVSPGTATITVITDDGDFEAECTVTVSEDFLIDDFEWVSVGTTYPMLNATASGKVEVELAPDGEPGQVLHVHGANVDSQWGVVGNRGHAIFSVKLPEGKVLGDFTSLTFDSFVLRGSDTGGTSDDGAGWYGGGAIVYITDIDGGNVLNKNLGYNWRYLGGITIDPDAPDPANVWSPRQWARGMTIVFSVVFGDDWTDKYKDLNEFKIGASSDSGAINFLIDNVMLKK